MTGITKWANKHQHLVHHMYGSVYDAPEEIDSSTKLPSFPFQTFAQRMWNVANDEKFLLVVDPGEHSAYLPRVGEPCKIRSDAFTFSTIMSDTKLPHAELSRSEEERKKQHRTAVTMVLETLDSLSSASNASKWVTCSPIARTKSQGMQEMRRGRQPRARYS
jgi:hypothetical protein